MTLTTNDVDEGIEFCLTVYAPGAENNYDSYYGIEWSDGPVTSLEDADAFNGIVFNAYFDDPDSLTWYVYHGYLGEYDDNIVWTIDTDQSTWECDADTTDCVGFVCATRALEVEGFLTLPFADGSSFRAIYDSTGFTGVVYSGAMSLGLALAATAGAALTRM